MKETHYLILSAGSAVGKGTLIQALKQADPTLGFAISSTTRLPREGESDGVQYYFEKEEDMIEMIEAGCFLEYTVRNGVYYGTLRAELERHENVVICDLDIKGAYTLKQLYPQTTTLVYLKVNPKEQEKRLRSRPDSTITEEEIQWRLNASVQELHAARDFDHIITNDHTDLTLQLLQTFIADIRKNM